MAVFTRDYSKLYVISEEARDETVTKLGVEDVTKIHYTTSIGMR